MSNQKKFVILLVIAAIAGGGYYFYAKGLKAKTDAELFSMIAGGGAGASAAEAEVSLRARTGKIGVDSLRAHLKDEVPAARKSAIGGLAIKKDKDSAKALIAMLENPKEDAEVKAAACRAFADIRVKEAIPTLLAMLDFKSEDVRMAASEALRSITKQAYSNKEADKWKNWWTDNGKSFEVKE